MSRAQVRGAVSPYGASDITYVDDFCGAGGSSQGLAEAGLQLVQAANHFAKAIETHAANFPDADHLETDLLLYDMRRRPRPDVYWASPECTWHSPAGGRKRRRHPELDLFDDYVPNAAGERSRLTMMQVVAFAEAKRPKVVLVENVVEVAGWELFEVWLEAMKALGYDHQILSVSAAHVWSAFNAPAPQWRDRVYFVFYRRGILFPDVSPRPWALCPECGDYTRARQSWKRPGRRIGKYRQQYRYTCPAHPRMIVEPLVAPAMDALDLSDLGTRIADRKRPLAPATQRRIRVGAAMFAHAPELAAHSGYARGAAASGHRAHGRAGGYDRVAPVDVADTARNSSPGDAIGVPFVDVARTHNLPSSLEVPLAPLTTGRNHAVVTPFVTRHFNPRGEGLGHLSSGLDAPLHPVTASGGNHSLVVPYAVTLRRGAHPYQVDGSAAPTITAGGNHHGLVMPFLSKHHGGLDYRPIGHMNKPVTVPLPTIVTSPNVSLVTPTARPKLDLDMEAVDAIDISEFFFRMLQWREHATAQRFPTEYHFTGNASENTLMAGNAVAANVAHYLGLLTRVALGDFTLADVDLQAHEAAA